MANTKATKQKTVKARILVAFDENGHWDAEGDWFGGKRRTDESQLKRLKSWCSYPHFCFVDVVLEVPKPATGKVVKITKTKGKR